MTKSLLIEFAMLCVLVVVLVCIPAYASHKQQVRIQQLESQLQEERKAKEIELYQLKEQLAQAENNRKVSCLATNVYHEARGESERGMEAVAQVTLNRTVDEKFPDDVCAVVYQKKPNGKCQFSWYCDGKSDEVRDQKSWQLAVAIAKRALRGETVNAVGRNVVYYHSTRVRPYWAYKKRFVAMIGRHRFYSDRS